MEVIKIEGLEVQPFKVHHGGSTKKGVLPEIPAYGFQVKSSEIKIAYSGDTCFFNELKTYFEGVDLALVEATMRDKGSEVHLSETEALKAAEGAIEVFLIHKVLQNLIEKK